MTQTIQLTPRLRAAADWVRPGALLCDVGTDHAHLPAALVLEGQIQRAIASDIRTGPLERAGETVRRCGLRKQIELRLCPGLEKINPGEADTVTICGMGGEMICGILAAAPWTKEGVRLILQPQRSQAELRLWLRENGYRILAERVIPEGQRWYTLLLAEGGKETLPVTPAGLLAGYPACWVQETQRLPYLDALEQKLNKLQDSLEHSSKPADVPRRAELRRAGEELSCWRQLLEKGVWPQ